MPDPNQRRGHWSVRLLLLLFAGALTSVIVAWAAELHLAYFSGTKQGKDWWASWQTRYDYADPDGPDRFLTRLEYGSVGFTFCWLFRNSHSHLPSEKESGVPALPSWFVPPNHHEPLRGSGAFGLPLRCLKYDIVIGESESLTPTRDSYHHAIYWEWDGGKKQLALPTAPILPGLLLNTLFYATLFSTPYLLRQTRHHLRLRRGHCPFCNYDIRGQYTLCPECGTALPSSSACETSSAAS